MKKSSILSNFIVSVGILCCVFLTGCNVLNGNKNLIGDYRLVSFETQDGTTYNVGDTYHGEEVDSDSICLNLYEINTGVVENDQLVYAPMFSVVMNIGDMYFSMGKYQRDHDELTFPYQLPEWDGEDSYQRDDYDCIGKVDGNRIILTFPDSCDIHTAVMVKEVNFE